MKKIFIIFLALVFSDFALADIENINQCAGMAYALGLNKEGKIFTNSASEQSYEYYKKEGLKKEEINVLVANSVHGRITSIKRQYVPMVQYRRDALIQQYKSWCTDIYLKIKGISKWPDLLEKANNGDATSQYELALNYAKDNDLENLLKWYIKAAKQEHALAQEELGSIYSIGKWGSKKDKEKALFWLTKSFENGNDYAAYSIAHQNFYSKSKTEEELKTAYVWYSVYINKVGTQGGMGKAAEKNIQKLDKLISSTSMLEAKKATDKLTK